VGDWAVTAAGAQVTLDNGSIAAARIGLTGPVAPHGTLSAPFGGLSAWGSWHAADVAVAAMVLTAIVVGLAHWRQLVGAVVLGYTMVAVVLGRLVWLRWPDFSRVLLPATVLAAALLLTESRPATAVGKSPLIPAKAAR
jgi:hypothetical protein